MAAKVRKRTICRVEGCEKPRVKTSFMCIEHLGQKRRCEGEVCTYDTQGNLTSQAQCKRSATPGNLTCAYHDGGRMSDKAKASKAKALQLSAINELIPPYEGSVNPFEVFEGEYRRTLAKIRFYENQIAGLQDAQALVWGKTKVESTTVGEFPGTTITHEARINLFEELLWRERKHLLELNKVVFKGDIDDRRLSMMRTYVDATSRAMDELVRALGHDPHDQHNAELILRAFDSSTEGYDDA